MSAKVASDLDHPEFTGATNPDGRLAVQFYSRPLQNDYRSNVEGRPIFQDVDFVKIFVPGDTTTVIDVPVREEHKKRFPIHWAHYQNKHGSDSKEIGTPLSQWPRLSQSQVEELRALKFFTVENIANASDQNLQKLGMAAGMSPFAFRDHAIRFLALAKDDSTAQAAEDRAKALEAQIEAMRKETDEKIAAAVTAALAAQPKKRGPKPKVAAA